MNRIKSWFEKNWLTFIVTLLMSLIIIGLSILFYFGCEKGWLDCTMTNSTKAYLCNCR